MKTFQEAILKVRDGKIVDKYRELTDEALRSKEVMGLLTCAARHFAQDGPEDLSEEDLAAKMMQEMWMIFCAGLMTGMEMEKPD